MSTQKFPPASILKTGTASSDASAANEPASSEQNYGNRLVVPPHLFGRSLVELSRDHILELLEANSEGGIKIAFSGKTTARRLARAVRPRICRPVKTLNVGTPEQRAANMVVEGDNLQAMVTLYKERGHVDLILTDPPYNTGNDFRYNDKWDDDPNDVGLGEFVSADDGARHTKWMRFMWPRLQLMREMLKASGVLAICIDHRELFRLGQMLDEVFGEENRLAIINWQKAATKRNDAEHVSTATEYVLVYAKDKAKARTARLARTDAQDALYANPDGDPKGDWYGASPAATGRETHRGMVYAIQSPFTGELHYPPPRRHWAAEKATMKKWLEEWGSRYEERDLQDELRPALLLKGATDPRRLGAAMEDPVVSKASKRAHAIRERGNWPTLVFTKGGVGKPRKKTYLEQLQRGVVPSTFWAEDDYFEPVAVGCTSWGSSQSGTSEAGARELSAIVGDDHGFETVKPLKLFSKVIQIWSPTDGLIVDPFAGSGTTAHAVLAMNAELGAERRFILVEQGRPENGDSYARSLLADRVRRVIEGNWVNGKGTPLPGGYTFVELGKKVDAPVLLRMERDEMVDTVIASHFDATRRRGDRLVRIESKKGHREYKYLVAKNAEDEGFFLVWEGAGKNTDFTEAVYEACAEEATRAGLKSAPYHVYARLYRFQTDGIRFYQIPDQILADFGLDMRSDAFVSDEERP